MIISRLCFIGAPSYFQGLLSTPWISFVPSLKSVIVKLSDLLTNHLRPPTCHVRQAWLQKLAKLAKTKNTLYYSELRHSAGFQARVFKIGHRPGI